MLRESNPYYEPVDGQAPVCDSPARPPEVGPDPVIAPEARLMAVAALGHEPPRCDGADYGRAVPLDDPLAEMERVDRRATDDCESWERVCASRIGPVGPPPENLF